ncbi:hypothetical protein MYX84_14745 [Acidobacteria bacterium AH-259-O06]|nr:hypothetical protein [Acidobacteria bacterium AH-259-O06]
MIERFNRRLKEQRMGGKTDRNTEEFRWAGGDCVDLYDEPRGLPWMPPAGSSKRLPGKWGDRTIQPKAQRAEDGREDRPKHGRVRWAGGDCVDLYHRQLNFHSPAQARRQAGRAEKGSVAGDSGVPEYRAGMRSLPVGQSGEDFFLSEASRVRKSTFGIVTRHNGFPHRPTLASSNFLKLL